MQLPEHIKTINRSYESKFKEKGSQFLGKAYPINSIEEIDIILNDIRKQFYDATHHCYAYRLKNGEFKYSDDGEPNGTAGIRILNAIDHFEFTDILIIVIRYFGGTKLGIGPLGKAYYYSAELTLKDAQVIIQRPFREINITTGFQNLSHVHRLISSYNAIIENTRYDESSHFTCLTENNAVEKFQNELFDLLKGDVTIKISEKVIYL